MCGGCTPAPAPCRTCSKEGTEDVKLFSNMSIVHGKLSLPDPPHGVAHAVQGGGEGGEARHAGDHGQHEPADQSELSIVTIDQSQLT